MWLIRKINLGISYKTAIEYISISESIVNLGTTDPFMPTPDVTVSASLDFLLNIHEPIGGHN